MATSQQAPKFKIDDEDQFFEDFPSLKQAGHKVTSPSTPAHRSPLVHNCFAYTVGRRKWWWPTGEGQWHEDCRFGDTIESFIRAYAKYGFKPCLDGSPVKGTEKVVAYAKGEAIQHVAIQLTSRPGMWRSKCGFNVDIEHTIDGLNGDCYGFPRYFFERKKVKKRARKKRVTSGG